MATTDTRSGFRLPWSSDKSNEPAPAVEPPDEAPEAAAEAAGEGAVAWPSSDINESLGLTSQPRPADPSDPAAPADPVAPIDPQEPEMIETPPVAPPAPAAPKKPSKLMADLTTAIRATAEAAREQSLAQLDADVAAVVAQIRTGSKDGEGALRLRSDEDIAGIKEWSRAEIARIKVETEHRIDARKITLGEELAGHAAAIDERVGEVEGAATTYHAAMDAYAARLQDEDDPARLATMAESMPEPPALDSWADLDSMIYTPIVAAVEAEAVVEPVVAEVEAVVEPVVEPAVEPEATWAEPEGTGWEPAEGAVAVAVAEGEEIVGEVVAETTVETETVEAQAEAVESAWGAPEAAWSAAAATDTIEPEAAIDTVDASGTEPGDDVPRWTAGETPEGFPTGDDETDEAGAPVDRGAIMAALEAAAEAVVAAEAASDSADQAEAAADVAETAAELLKGRMDTDEEIDPEAAAALSARMGAGGLEESYADRLASLLPNHGEGDADGEPRTTQVVVSGLVSVASIASFKRHLGRLAGVTAVAVASGPDGEFVFNVTHRPDVSFRDAVPTMPGFAARVTSSADGVVQVTARDPEAEG